MLGPGAAAPGPTHVAAPAARAWAIAAANMAVRVPATNAEAAAWTVRGWADVAVGCLALAGPAPPGSPPSGSAPSGSAPSGSGPDQSGAFGGLDEVVRAVPTISGGPHAARLRRVRELAGPVPPWYPGARPDPRPRAVRLAGGRSDGGLRRGTHDDRSRTAVARLMPAEQRTAAGLGSALPAVAERGIPHRAPAGDPVPGPADLDVPARLARACARTRSRDRRGPRPLPPRSRSRSGVASTKGRTWTTSVR